MESSLSKSEVMIKPLFLKAGIPLILSIAGIVSARIISRKYIISAKTQVCSLRTIDSNHDDQEKFYHNLDNNSINQEQNVSNSDIGFSSQVEMLTKIEELQKRELDLEIKFLKYQEMKNQEFVLMEMKNMLVLESAHVGFLGKEISLMEAEKERFEKLVLEYLRILEQNEFAKIENGILGRKVKNISRKLKQQWRLIREKDLKIEATEKEILKCYDEMEIRSSVIKKMEDEVRELQEIVKQLQEEKNELLINLNAVENSKTKLLLTNPESDTAEAHYRVDFSNPIQFTTPKIDSESIPKEEYNQILNELEQLRKDRAAENAEVTYLRWTNACLRHELMKNGEEIEEKKEIENGVGEIRNYGLDLQTKNESLIDVAESSPDHHHHAYSKRKRLLQKIKKWVEGNDHHRHHPMKLKVNHEKGKHEMKCIGRLSGAETEEEEDHFIHARRSCSSA